METRLLNDAEKEALQGLMDDPSPVVRRALLARFAALGPAAAGFLQEIAGGANRLLGPHAAWFIDELKLGDPHADFRRYIRSRHHELETGIFLLARTLRQDLDTDACRSAIDGFAARCRELISEPSPAREKCRVINRVLFHECGFRGNVEAFTDPMNSLMDRVLERRKGLPLTLSILYLLVARRIGLVLEPVSLPGYFIVGYFGDDGPFFVDPFDRGLFRDREDVSAQLWTGSPAGRPAELAPATVREVLCRNCRNLSNHFTAAQDLARAQLFAEFVEEFETAFERPVQP